MCPIRSIVTFQWEFIVSRVRTDLSCAVLEHFCSFKGFTSFFLFFSWEENHMNEFRFHCPVCVYYFLCFVFFFLDFSVHFYTAPGEKRNFSSVFDRHLVCCFLIFKLIVSVFLWIALCSVIFLHFFHVWLCDSIALSQMLLSFVGSHRSTITLRISHIRSIFYDWLELAKASCTVFYIGANTNLDTFRRSLANSSTKF